MKITWYLHSHLLLRNALISIALGLIFPSVPTLAQRTNVNFDHSVIFAKCHTCSWHRVQMTDPFFVQRLKDAVGHEYSA